MLIGGLLLFIHGFLWAYPRILRWCLEHKLVFLSIPLGIVLVGGMVWLGFDRVLGWLPDGLRASRPVAAIAALLALARQGRAEDQSDLLTALARLPLETLAFFRFRDDMKVLELFPGSGWYTRLLAPVLADRGKLFLALGTGRVARATRPLPRIGRNLHEGLPSRSAS